MLVPPIHQPISTPRPVSVSRSTSPSTIPEAPRLHIASLFLALHLQAPLRYRHTGRCATRCRLGSARLGRRHAQKPFNGVMEYRDRGASVI